MIYGAESFRHKPYRTKTYIAADWDSDNDAVEQLHKWNNSQNWSLSFHDAHELKQAKDSSLNCSIKKSLKDRMDASKTFVLIVGDHTDTVTKGSCHLCGSYNSYVGSCARGYTVDYRSFVKYECDKAVEAGIKIVVLYKSTIVNKSKCPAAVKNRGTHVAMIYKGDDGKYYWDYQAVKKALLLSTTSSGSLYGKTGTGRVNGKDVNGWFIGYIETSNNTYYFATNIQSSSGATGSQATEITKSVLSNLGIWK